MDPMKPYLVGAACVLLGFGLFQITQPARAIGTGPYALMQHSNPAANAGVFRIDTSSGAVSYCFIGNNNELFCSKEIK